MRLKNFETQVGELGWKEAGDLRGFSILWMGIMDEDLQIEGKECRSEDNKDMKKKIHARARKVLQCGIGDSV